MPSYVRLATGDPAPWFHQRTGANPRFAFDTVAGRYVVLCFFATAADPQSKAALDAATARRDLFDDRKASFFGVSMDPADEAEKRVADRAPGFRFFWDFDASVSRAYGAAPTDAGDRINVEAMRKWVILDPTLRIIDVIPFSPDGADIAAVLQRVEALPPPSSFAGFEISAPILVLPNVFDREFCRELVGLYETHGGEDSGFMREVGGKTVGIKDYGHKRRRDYVIEDQAIIDRTKALIQRRVTPEILKVHQFRVSRMERYIVACYDADEAAHFNAHRDNTTSGTAHRRFAVSINLNDDFDGGEVRFPEYGPRGYKAPVGGAVVFSCSLLHSVSTVTRGRRYAFLPFLYDEAAAKLREANNAKLGEGVGSYRAG
jgi:peroxiredoxin/predicted 2-oxoglutarate/Fe(II)-dependent dioxygenase YbiX